MSFNSHSRLDLSIRVGGVVIRDAESHRIRVAVDIEEADAFEIRLRELGDTVEKWGHGN